MLNEAQHLSSNFSWHVDNLLLCYFNDQQLYACTAGDEFKTDPCCYLDIIIESTHLVPPSVQQPEGVVVAKVLKLQQHVWLPGLQ